MIILKKGYGENTKEENSMKYMLCLLKIVFQEEAKWLIQGTSSVT